MGGKGNIFLFVIWSAARTYDEQIADEIGKRFKVLSDFEVAWPKRHFTRNLAAFYGWKNWFVWRNKARKCGTGPFRVIKVEDPSPVWVNERDTSGHELTVDENIYRLKKSFRALTGRSNVVHSSVTAEETAHQLAALESSKCDPIPFRAMSYPDDAIIRTERRRVWLGILADLCVPLGMSVVAGVVVWLDAAVIGVGYSECRLIEWTGLALSVLCGGMMTALAVRSKSGRGAHALFAAFFFDMALREAERSLNMVFGSNLWMWVLTSVTLTFAAVTLRYAKTVYSGLRAVRESWLFPVFMCGAALMLFVSQFVGRAAVWRALDVADAPRVSHFVDESVELFGYVLMSAWVVSYVCGGRRHSGGTREIQS